MNIPYNVRRILIWIVFILFSYEFSFSKIPDYVEESVYTLAYAGFKTDLSAYSSSTDVYFSLNDILSFFILPNEIKNNGKLIEGYTTSIDTSFIFDITEKYYKNIKGEKKSFKEIDYFITDIEVYVSTALLKDLFDWEIETYNNQLLIYIKTKSEMPLLREWKRSKKGVKTDQISGTNTFAPLLYDKNWNWFNGGILDYSVGAYYGTKIENYSFSGNLGLQVLGGDLQVNSNGGFNNIEKTQIINQAARWRYNFTENKYLSQIAIGDVSNMSYRSGSLGSVIFPTSRIQGIQISNENTLMPSSFSLFTIEDQIDPGWEVELYINNQLFGRTKTDPSGYYKFILPMNYGNTGIDLKFYGPKGEYISKERIIDIPSQFLPPGEIKYSISYGKDFKTRNYLSEIRNSIGLTNWMSNSITVSKEDTIDQYNILNQTSFRLPGNFIFDLYYSPKNLYSAGINVHSDLLGSYALIYTKFLGESIFNTKKVNESAMLFITLPRFYDLPFNISIRSNVDKINQELNSTNDIGLYLNIYGISISNRFIYFLNKNFSSGVTTFSHNFTSDISFYWNQKPSFLQFIGNTRFSVNGYFNTSENKFVSWSANISQQLYKNIDANFIWRKDIASGVSTLDLRLTINLNEIRSNSSSNYNFDNKEYALGQDLSGTIGFDSENRSFYISNSIGGNSIGRGAANVRFYIDNNNNSIYDEGDVEIPDVDFDIPNSSIERSTSSNTRRVFNLIPGGRYNLILNKESIKNPLYSPKMNEFSFIADPNVTKQIDVPLYVTGIIEGNISFNDGIEKRPLSRVRIHINSVDNSIKKEIPVLADGTFYYMGIPQGKYIAYVDSSQVKILNSSSNPQFIEFEIKISIDGDIVSDLNFELIANEKRKVSVDVVESNQNKVQNIQDSIPKDYKELVTLELEKKDKKVNNIIKEVPLKISDPIKIGKLISIKFNKSRITFLSNPHKKYLDKVADFMTFNPNSKLQIIGHSDNFGSLDENLEVSNRRAKEVASYLVQKGINKNRLLINAKGALEPIGDNKILSGKFKNMRVEMTLIK